MSLESRRQIYETLMSAGIEGTVVSPVARSEDPEEGLDPSLIDITVPNRSARDKVLDSLREGGLLLRDITLVQKQIDLQVEQNQEPIVLEQISHSPIIGSSEEVVRLRNLAAKDPK